MACRYRILPEKGRNSFDRNHNYAADRKAVSPPRPADEMVSMKLPKTLLIQTVLSIILIAISQYALAEYSGYIISTHSQYDDQIPVEEIVRILKKSGVTKVILSTRGELSNKGVLLAAQQYPDLIYPAVRTKTGIYLRQDKSRWRKYINKTTRSGKFTGFQELLLYHAPKFSKKGKKLAPEVFVRVDDPLIATVIEAASNNGWPVPLHYEFRAVNDKRRDAFLAQMKVVLDNHPKQAFTLMHMGQLGPGEVRALLDQHTNLYFHLSMTANVYRRSQYPWIAMFMKKGKSGTLQPQWKTILEEYPGRFLLAFDGVFPWVWRRDIPKDVAEWRTALETLPPQVADLIAHGNAERLWPRLRQ